MSGKSSQHGLRTEHPTLRKGITWKFILESVATQCGKEYDELGVPTKVSMAGQWERISECPLETNGWRQIARSYQMVSKESATVVLFGKWVFSSVIYLTITTLGHREPIQSQSQGQISIEESTEKSHEDQSHTKLGASGISSEKERLSGRIHCRLLYPVLGEDANLLFCAT